LLAGLDTTAAWARGEAGWHPRAGLDVYGYGEARAAWGATVEGVVGVGVRATW
jgi:hypothetical protein